jgi:hypothetical protein
MTTNARELAELATAYAGGNGLSFRNRIINGSMVINQRGFSGAISNQTYTLDRWITDRFGGVATATVQQSTLAPVGFNNSLLYTVGTGATPATTDYSNVRQYIEGFNVADLGFGTAAAQTVTLSFWVRSSVTGTFGVSLNSSSYDRGYIASYTISAANTWEYKTVVIPGDTTGTWLNDNGTGIRVIWDLGVGPTYSSAAGSWSSTFAQFGLAGGTKLAATAGATWQITGVQLEAGSVATPFERRPYGTELALCQRYFFSVNAIGTSGTTVATTKAIFTLRPPVTMRSAPTVTYANQGRITYATVVDYVGTYFGESRTITPDSIGFFYTQSSGSTFTQNVPVALNDTSVSCVITGSAEL